MTRFDEISPLWRNFQSLWGHFGLVFANFCTYFGNFYATGQIFSDVPIWPKGENNIAIWSHRKEGWLGENLFLNPVIACPTNITA